MKYRLGLIAVACAVTATGCGGSGTKATSTPSSAASSTRAGYIAAGDKVCAEVNSSLKDLQGQANVMVDKVDKGSATLDELEPVLRKAYEVSRDGQTRFAAIAPPAGDREVIDKLNEAYEQQVALLGREADAARRNDIDALTSLKDETQRATDRSHALAQGYGFKVCGTG